VYAKSIILDDWHGAKSDDREMEVEGLEQVEWAIRQLNGRNHTLAVLDSSEDRVMSVGGGTDGCYVVNVAVNVDEEFHNLVDPDKGPGETKVVVGGQSGYYPSRICVDLESAIEAGRRFAEDGSLSDRLTWEKG
jgi:hypothetical protein